MIAMKIIGQSLYEGGDFTIESAIHDQFKNLEISERDKEWAEKNIDMLVFLADKFHEDIIESF
jgi:hypothetical protein